MKKKAFALILTASMIAGLQPAATAEAQTAHLPLLSLMQRQRSLKQKEAKAQQLLSIPMIPGQAGLISTLQSM